MNFSLTVPDRERSRAVADELAERGHRLVTVRPTTPGGRPEPAGWWNVSSLVVDPPSEELEEPQAEIAAMGDIARRYGGTVAGSYGKNPDLNLKIFNRDGLVHELDPAEAETIRARILAVDVPPRVVWEPAPQLEGTPVDEEAELRETTDALTQALVTEGPRYLHFDPAGFDSGNELLWAFFDEVWHQGGLTPSTTAGVRVLADVASTEAMSDDQRALILLFLCDVATSGRRRLGRQADRLRAEQLPAEEFADEIEVRSAVTTVLPRVAKAVAGRSEPTDLLLAAVCASCPEAKVELPAGLARIARRVAGTALEPIVALIEVLAAQESAALDAALAAAASAYPNLVHAWESPEAPVVFRAYELVVGVLKEL